MKTKDQSNQNPENENLNQDENSLPVEETVENVETIEAQADVAAEAVDEGLSAELTVVEPEVPAGAEEEMPVQVPLAEEEQVPVEAESEEIIAEADVPVVAGVTSAEEIAAEEVSEEEAVVENVEELVPLAEPESEPVVEIEPVAEENVIIGIPAPAAEDSLLTAEEPADEDESDEIEEHIAEGNALFEGLTRDQLVDKLEDLVKDPNVNAIKAAVGLVRIAFLKLNKEFKQELYQKLAEVNVDADAETAAEVQPVQDDAIEERFKAAFNIYKQNKAKYNEEQEKVKVKNLEAKTHILEELKLLINSEETLKKTYDEFKTLQERWKTIGMVPKGDINTLWQNYHFLVEKFFDKVKINKELKDLDLKKNLEVKVHLCEKAEELLLETSIIKSFKQLQQYHEEWKEVGPVPQDKKDELWERFRSATEKINERRREYYNEMQESLEQNYAAKVILCEKAEQLMAGESDSIKAWQDTTAQITELLKIWKTIGPAPKKQNNEIWARFKTSLDGFFNTKKEYFNKLKEQQMHNFNLKLDLCVQAESLRNSTDWKNTSRELINLQNEWKKIGPVPRKQSDRIWKRFRAACDEFFSTKTEYFKNVSSHEDENMKLKLDLIEKVKEFEVGDDRNQAVETLKDFQRQWMEIGHVPIKEKEKLQADFRLLINKHFEKLKMESMSMGANNYRNRVERMAKDSPDAGRVISKERSFVLGKIQQLQDEIKTWENNIGFFANSKTANLLKQEFEKKIDKAKEELQMLEAKLKMLREANQ
ncbi:MAG: DUF349 domain-containing protein [Bacteroidales bacterium]|nr:DUF349 domain-containing protein [Bacteroidales bacterium]